MLISIADTSLGVSYLGTRARPCNEDPLHNKVSWADPCKARWEVTAGLTVQSSSEP